MAAEKNRRGSGDELEAWLEDGAPDWMKEAHARQQELDKKNQARSAELDQRVAQFQEDAAQQIADGRAELDRKNRQTLANFRRKLRGE